MKKQSCKRSAIKGGNAFHLPTKHLKQNGAKEKKIIKFLPQTQLRYSSNSICKHKTSFAEAFFNKLRWSFKDSSSVQNLDQETNVLEGTKKFYMQKQNKKLEYYKL